MSYLVQKTQKYLSCPVQTKPTLLLICRMVPRKRKPCQMRRCVENTANATNPLFHKASQMPFLLLYCCVCSPKTQNFLQILQRIKKDFMQIWFRFRWKIFQTKIEIFCFMKINISISIKVQWFAWEKMIDCTFSLLRCLIIFCLW